MVLEELAQQVPSVMLQPLFELGRGQGPGPVAIQELDQIGRSASRTRRRPRAWTWPAASSPCSIAHTSHKLGQAGVGLRFELGTGLTVASGRHG